MAKENFFQAYTRWASRLLNKPLEKQLPRFDWVKTDIRAAHMNVLVREWLSTSVMSAVIAFGLSIPLLIVAGVLLAWTPESVLGLILGGSMAITGSVFALLIYYPKTKARQRKKSIDRNLAFAALYMNTIAGTGAPPYLIFKLLADFKEYGAVSEEAQRIVEEVEVMGRDVEDAMKHAADQATNEDWKDLLNSMNTVMVRGGDIRKLMYEKSRALMEGYRRTIQEYTNDLTIYVEIYITLVIVGAIFGLVMTTILGTISGFEDLRAIQQILVYVFLPIASMGFIAMLKMTSPLQ